MAYSHDAPQHLRVGVGGTTCLRSVRVGLRFPRSTEAERKPMPSLGAGSIINLPDGSPAVFTVLDMFKLTDYY